MEIISKNDFVELDYTAKANNQIFFTTNKEEAAKLGMEANPIIISVGNQMLMKELDDFIIGKEKEKKYSLHLTPEKAFGKRDPNLVRTVSKGLFKDKEYQPYPGMTLQLETGIARVVSVSGGRVTIDFNNPLAGKDIDYEFEIKRKITDINEKINALQDFYFRNQFEFEIKDNKVIFKKQEIKPFIDVFKEKFKEMLGMDVEVEEKKEDEKKP